MLETFCHDRLKYFAADRNNPTKNALSNLSPWFHAGMCDEKQGSQKNKSLYLSVEGYHLCSNINCGH